MHLRAHIIILICVLSTSLLADDSQWRQCTRQPSQYQPGNDPSTAEDPRNDSQRVHLFRIDQDVHADRVQYSEKDKKAIATGNVLLRDPDLDITAADCCRAGIVKDVRYRPGRVIVRISYTGIRVEFRKNKVPVINE